MVKLRAQLPAYSILEVLVALIILVACFSAAISVLSNRNLSNNSVESITIRNTAKIFIDEYLMDSNYLVEKEYKDGDYFYKIEAKPFLDCLDLKKIHLEVRNKQGIEIDNIVVVKKITAE